MGHHELQGKIVELKQPVAILEKHTDEANMDTEKSHEEEASVSYKVTAVIRRKIIFMIR